MHSLNSVHKSTSIMESVLVKNGNIITFCAKKMENVLFVYIKIGSHVVSK